MKYPLFFVLGFLSCLASCKKGHNKQDIEVAMQRYDRYVKQMDTNSLAMLYAPDGELGTIAKGRDSIRHFLSHFNNVRVLSQKSDCSSVEINGDSAIQKGTYKQTAIVDGKDTVKLKGDYVANWKWTPEEKWRITKMTTTPAH
jgi:hypothetical protein